MQTKYKTSFDYKELEAIVQVLDEWTEDQMKNASDSFKGFWAVSAPEQLQYYEVQNALIEGTYMSLG